MPEPERVNESSSATGTGCSTVSSSWKPSARRPRMLSSRLTLQGDGRMRGINKKGANRGVLAPGNWEVGLVFEDAESTAGHHGEHLAAAETQIRVRAHRGVRDHAGH